MATTNQSTVDTLTGLMIHLATTAYTTQHPTSTAQKTDTMHPTRIHKTRVGAVKYAFEVHRGLFN